MPRGPEQTPPSPGNERKSVPEILRATAEQLQMAELGLADLTGDDPTRRMPGLRNVAVWGRAVTNALEKLRTPLASTFDDWYRQKAEAMANDELMKYFYRLRSAVLKGADTPAVTSVKVRMHIDTNKLRRLQAEAPPGARGFFSGDPLGGSGWNVEQPDGTTGRYYATLPDDFQANISLHLDAPPTTHGGETLTDTSIEALAEHYVEYLRGLVREAMERFGPSQADG